MSKKKNKKNEPVLSLVAPTKKAEDEFEALANNLFSFMKNSLKINNTIYSERYEIVSFIESEEKADDIVCYTISPSANKDVSVYVDNKVINVELNKKIVGMSLNDYKNLASAIIKYLTKYYEN